MSENNLQPEKGRELALTGDEFPASGFTVLFLRSSDGSFGWGSFLRGLVLIPSQFDTLPVGELSLGGLCCFLELCWLVPLPTCSIPGISTTFPQSGLAFGNGVSGLLVCVHWKAREGRTLKTMEGEQRTEGSKRLWWNADVSLPFNSWCVYFTRLRLNVCHVTWWSEARVLTKRGWGRLESTCS